MFLLMFLGILFVYLEGFSGTTIKDTWTNPRGRVEAREGVGFGWGGEKMQTIVTE